MESLAGALGLDSEAVRDLLARQERFDAAIRREAASDFAFWLEVALKSGAIVRGGHEEARARDEFSALFERNIRAFDLYGQKRTRRGSISRAVYMSVLVSNGGRCLYCDSAVATCIDHVEPLARGGEHRVENFAPACRPCNQSKHAREPIGWLMKHRGNEAVERLMSHVNRSR